jgi:hypothetical protein
MTLIGPGALFVVTAGAAFIVPQFLSPSLRRWSLVPVAVMLAVVFFWVVAGPEGHITVVEAVLVSIAAVINGLSLRVCNDCGTPAMVGQFFPALPTTCRRCGGPLVGIAKPAPKVPEHVQHSPNQDPPAPPGT